MIKKLIAIIACIVLVSVCFTACGDKNKNETSNGSDNVAESTNNEQGGDTTSALTEEYDAERDPYAEDLDNWEISQK